MRLLTLAAALAALLLTIALTNAQEPPESQTATRLEPGINLVGWVGEPTSTSQLFREIPQLESIWSWDAELDDWIVAGRGAPEWLGGLGRVWAGTGLRLVLGGEEPFLWQRSTEPTRGLVELRTGWNLVAWSGADDAPLEQVAKGIGWSLRELRRWDAASQQWATWTSPERSPQLIAASATDQGATDEESEPATVRRGEALWVNVARSVNWLQPTDILPRLVFPGGASDELQARVREDLESVLAFYGQQYGIQADPGFTVYVAKDVEALIQMQRDERGDSGDGEEVDEDVRAAYLRALWNRAGGWGGGEIVVKQTSWPEDLSTSEIARSRYTLTHEYFHILQWQLSDAWASQWLVEGTADWVEGGHRVLDGEQTLEALRERELSELSPRTPTLRSAEQENAQWEYTLGWLAIDRLTATAGGGSYIEFWRRLAPTEIGSHHRWTSTPDWRTAFQETFGVPVSSFYADFDAWQREQAAANEASASSGDDDARWIRGRITDEGGAPVAGVFVNAIRVEGETSVGRNQRAETDAGGGFAVRAPEDGDYRISVDIAADCTRYYYSDGGLVNKRGDAQLVTVAESDEQSVDIQLPPSICGDWFIRGRVVDDAGQPLPGVTVVVRRHGNHTCSHWAAGFTWPTRFGHNPVLTGLTQLDGSFAVRDECATLHTLSLELASGCLAYYSEGGVITSFTPKSSTLIDATETGGLDLQIRVPTDICPHRISGYAVDVNGAPLTDKWISWQSFKFDQPGTGILGWRRVSTDANGRYEIHVPSDGKYYFDSILLRRIPACSYYNYFEGQTLSSQKGTVRVSGADVVGVELRLPGTIEELCG